MIDTLIFQKGNTGIPVNKDNDWQAEEKIMIERQFKIKVGTLRRMKKDLEYYIKEHATQQVKIEKMRIDEKDEHDVRKQEEVLVETETMLPDCHSRLKEVAIDVSNFIEAHRDEVEPLETFKEAQELLAAIPTLLQ